MTKRGLRRREETDVVVAGRRAADTQRRRKMARDGESQVSVLGVVGKMDEGTERVR